jgi:hypothetical protein
MAPSKVSGRASGAVGRLKAGELTAKQPAAKKAAPTKLSIRDVAKPGRGKVEIKLRQVRKRGEELSTNIEALLARLG